MEEPWYASVSRCIAIHNCRKPWQMECCPRTSDRGPHRWMHEISYRFDPPRRRFSNRELTCHHVKYEFLFFHSRFFNRVRGIGSIGSIGTYAYCTLNLSGHFYYFFTGCNLIRNFRITGAGCFSSKWNMLCSGSCSGYSCWQSVSWMIYGY